MDKHKQILNVKSMCDARQLSAHGFSEVLNVFSVHFMHTLSKQDVLQTEEEQQSNLNFN